MADDYVLYSYWHTEFITIDRGETLGFGGMYSTVQYLETRGDSDIFRTWLRWWKSAKSEYGIGAFPGRDFGKSKCLL